MSAMVINLFFGGGFSKSTKNILPNKFWLAVWICV